MENTAKCLNILWPKNRGKQNRSRGSKQNLPLPPVYINTLIQKPLTIYWTYDSPTEIGWPEIPNGDREICRLISRRTDLISGLPGDQSTIFSDSCLIFITWLWTGTPFCANLSSLFIFMFSVLSITQWKKRFQLPKFPSYPSSNSVSLYVTIYNGQKTLLMYHKL